MCFIIGLISKFRLHKSDVFHKNGKNRFMVVAMVTSRFDENEFCFCYTGTKPHHICDNEENRFFDREHDWSVFARSYS